MTDVQIVIIGNVITILFLTIACGSDLLYTMLGGKFFSAVLLTWMLSVVLMFFLSIIGIYLEKTHPEQIEIIMSVFPDNIIVMPFLWGGWLYGLIAASLGSLVRLLIKKVKKHLKSPTTVSFCA